MSAAGIGAAASVGSSSGKTGRDLRWVSVWEVVVGWVGVFAKVRGRGLSPSNKKNPLSPPPQKKRPSQFKNSRKNHAKQSRRVQWRRLTYNEANIPGPDILETDTYLTGGAFVADRGALRSASRAGGAPTGMEKGISLTEETMTH